MVIGQGNKRKYENMKKNLRRSSIQESVFNYINCSNCCYTLITSYCYYSCCCDICCCYPSYLACSRAQKPLFFYTTSFSATEKKTNQSFKIYRQRPQPQPQRLRTTNYELLLTHCSDVLSLNSLLYTTSKPCLFSHYAFTASLELCLCRCRKHPRLNRYQER